MLEKIKEILKLKKEEKIKPRYTSTTRAGRLIEILKAKHAEETTEKKKEKKRKKHIFPEFRISPVRRFVMLPNEVKTQVRYPLIEPYAYAVIKRDIRERILTYNVIEPFLTEEEKKILEKLKQGLIATINISLTAIKNEQELMRFLEDNIQMLIEEYGFDITPEQYLKFMYYIYRDFVGLNEIEPLMSDPYIEDLGIDGVGLPVYIVHQKYGSLKTNIVYNDIEKLREFVVKLAERCDRYISYAEPLLDGTLPDGSRVQATLASDVTTRGPTFSIRKFREEPFTPVDMIILKTASSELLAYLWFCIESRANILICGGTGTGKTSFLNAISLFIPIEAKIVSIEDTRELALPHEHWIPGVTRASFTGTKIGEVTMFDLLRESFRQNPDYLVVGEVRGKEAYVMFQGMASGHPSFSTMHAASLEDVIKRLESPPIELSPALLETLDIVIVMVHAREHGKSARRVKEVMEIQSIDKETGKANAVKAFQWIPVEDKIEYRGYSWVLNRISIEKGIPIEEIMKEIEQRKLILEWLVKHNIRNIKDVSKYIVMYQNDKKRLLNMIYAELGMEKEK
jgi:flagellar protein FlaI